MAWHTPAMPAGDSCCTGRGGATDDGRTAVLHRITFGSVDQMSHREYTEAIWSLMALVYTPSIGRHSTESVSRCVRALQALKAMQAEALWELVVPITNALLHMPCRSVANDLGARFVVEAIHADTTLAHLFYWAFTSVSTCPETGPATKKESDHYLAAIGQAFSPNTVSGTPLIDLLDRLKNIGEHIVDLKEKTKREAVLHEMLQKDINDRMVTAAPVPVHLLTSHLGGDAPLATVRFLPPQFAFVLSSRERAPFHVLVEVELDQAETEEQLEISSPWRCACRNRRSPAVSESMVKNGLRARLATPRTASMPSKSRVSLSESEIVAKFLGERDRRPKGVFGNESWQEAKHRVREDSMYGHKKNWEVISLIVKSRADDVRQEELAFRMLKWFQRVFSRRGLKLWLQPFIIIAMANDAGCLETMPNAISIDALKKRYGDEWTSLWGYFTQVFPDVEDVGTAKVVSLKTAVLNFIWSMAAYSIVCYVLAVKDRHNGNIMIDDQGHIIHVDFGFMLCGAPGGKVIQWLGGFEPSRAFKLTGDFLEVMGVNDADLFQVFRRNFVKGLMAVREDAEELLALLQLSMLGNENSQQRCFQHPRGYPEAVLEDICERLRLPLDLLGVRGDTRERLGDAEFELFAERLVDDSVDHWRSRVYDDLQRWQNGIR